MKKPVRTCCSCRKKMLKDDLIRFVWRDGSVQVDREKKMDGRGAYCCSTKLCTENFFSQQKKWKRLFRL